MNIVLKINKLIIGSVVVMASLLAVSLLVPQPASAELKDYACRGAEINLNSGNCDNDEVRGADNRLNSLAAKVVNILTIIIGIIAVVMIIIGGFQFITSGGDSNKISSARQTVVYAIVGLIIVALAQFIARFVLSVV